MKSWGAETGVPEDYEERVPEIKKQYAQFFKERFYFVCTSFPLTDNSLTPFTAKCT